MRFAVIERGERTYSAYVPDLPGCLSVGDTPEEARPEIGEAIEFHLEGGAGGWLADPEAVELG